MCVCDGPQTRSEQRTLTLSFPCPRLLALWQAGFDVPAATLALASGSGAAAGGPGGTTLFTEPRTDATPPTSPSPRLVQARSTAGSGGWRRPWAGQSRTPAARCSGRCAHRPPLPSSCAGRSQPSRLALVPLTAPPRRTAPAGAERVLQERGEAGVHPGGGIQSRRGGDCDSVSRHPRPRPIASLTPPPRAPAPLLFCRFVVVGGAEGWGAYFAGRPRRRRDVAEAGTGRVRHPPGYDALRYVVGREKARESLLWPE